MVYEQGSASIERKLLSGLVNQDVLFKFASAGAVFSPLFVPAPKFAEKFFFTSPAKGHSWSFALDDLAAFFAIAFRRFLLAHEPFLAIYPTTLALLSDAKELKPEDAIFITHLTQNVKKSGDVHKNLRAR